MAYVKYDPAALKNYTMPGHRLRELLGGAYASNIRRWAVVCDPRHDRHLLTVVRSSDGGLCTVPITDTEGFAPEDRAALVLFLS